jgi:hypothetical protein
VAATNVLPQTCFQMSPTGGAAGSAMTYTSNGTFTLPSPNFTFETWFYATTTAAHTLLSAVDAANGSVAVGCLLSGGFYRVSVNGNTLPATGGSAVAINAWHHIALQWLDASKTMRFWLNGVRTDLVFTGNNTMTTNPCRLVWRCVTGGRLMICNCTLSAGIVYTDALASGTVAMTFPNLVWRFAEPVLQVNYACESAASRLLDVVDVTASGPTGQGNTNLALSYAMASPTPANAGSFSLPASLLV